MDHMYQIKERLFLGPIAAADRSVLAKYGITHVISVMDCDIGHRQRVRKPATEADACTRLLIKAEDVCSSRLDRHFDVCSAFISEALTSGGAVLVHCKAGQSRSATVVIAYLMKEERWPLEKALRFVQEKRASVQPNAGFMEHLRALEARLSLLKSLDITTTPDCKAKDVAESLCEADVVDCCAAVEGDEEDEASTSVPSSPTSSDDGDSPVSSTDVQVEVQDLFGAGEQRLRMERLKSRYQRMHAASSLMSVAAPLRKRSKAYEKRALF